MGTHRWKKVLLMAFALATLIYIYTTVDPYDTSDSVWGLPLSGQVIVLDPGHGGRDGGAVSQSGLVEKEIALSISLYLRDYLQQSGALVLMTRETDRDLASEESHRQKRRKEEDFKNRLHFVNNSNADLFISIHLNSIQSPKWKGAQVFYNPQYEQSKRLAEGIQSEMIQNLDNTRKEPKKNQDIFMLRHTTMPGALVEVGFLSNPDEARLLSTEDYQKQVAASIYQGIIHYHIQEETNVQ